MPLKALEKLAPHSRAGRVKKQNSMPRRPFHGQRANFGARVYVQHPIQLDKSRKRIASQGLNCAPFDATFTVLLSDLPGRIFMCRQMMTEAKAAYSKG
ncbi:MAG: hypothetical protein WD448_11310 [Woeseia sp.]